MFQEIDFVSEGAILRGRLYTHKVDGNPTIVMAHGTTGTITMVIDAYAEAFFAAGFDVLLYEHRNFGISDGAPRQEINPWIQARGYRDAVTYLRQSRPRCKIALWGESYTGGLVMIAGALIADISAIVAQIPVCGITLPPGPIDDDSFAVMKDIFANGDVTGGPEQTVGPLPVVSADQMNAPSLLTPIQAFRWFVEHGGRHGSGWQNLATRVIPDTPVPCSPFVTAPHLAMPVMFMVGRDDEMVHCSPDVQRAVFDKIKGPKEFVEVDGGHFGILWHPSPLFDQAIKVEINFLRRALLGE